MVCKKCGYKDIKELSLFGSSLCRFCFSNAPKDIENFQNYVLEKIDWRILDTFRKYGQFPGKNQKDGMNKKAILGKIMARVPTGYSPLDGNLVLNQDASKVHNLFKKFSEQEGSLSSFARDFGFSANGLKKLLTNRTYLGEIKFNGQIYKGKHERLVSPELFYAVQRKLENKTI